MNAASYATWRGAWTHRPFRIAWLVAALVAVPMMALLPTFFAFVNAHPGWRPFDPVLPHLGPADTSVWTFSILYGTILLTVARAARSPLLLLRGVHAYLLMMVLRITCIRLVLLEPPLDIVPLIDPLTQHFYPGDKPFLKDLFFSGHTATLSLMVALARGRVGRWLTVLATVAMGVLVLVQHAHWTIDVLVAPVAVAVAWRLSLRSLRACGVEAA